METLTFFEIDFGSDFWKKDRKTSGKNVDVLRGQNIPGNSKTIDRTVGLGCIVSHKSTDFRLKSYQQPNRVYQLGMHFVRQLVRYKGEVRMDHQIGATYNLQWAVETGKTKRILEWFVPDFVKDLPIEKELLRVIANAKDLGVEVRIYSVKDY